MHRTHHLFHALLVAYAVCFFLSAVTCTVAFPLISVNEVLSNTVFFAGAMGMLLAGPAIFTPGILMILLADGIHSLVRSSVASDEGKRKDRAPNVREEVPDNIIWKLDWGERGER